MLNSRALTESLHVRYSIFFGRGGGGKIVNSLCYQNEEYPLPTTGMTSLGLSLIKFEPRMKVIKSPRISDREDNSAVLW